MNKKILSSDFINLAMPLCCCGDVCGRTESTSAFRIFIGRLVIALRTLLWCDSRLVPVPKTFFHQCVISFTCSQSYSDGSVLKQSHQSKTGYKYMI